MDDNSIVWHSVGPKRKSVCFTPDSASEESQPALCPVDNCRAMVAHTHLLRHLISVHLDCRPRSLPFQLRMREVFSGQKTLLMLSYRQLPVDRDQCLAVLNWRSIHPCPRQLDLPPCHQSLTYTLPVLVMACRTTWKALLTQHQREGEGEREQEQPDSEMEQEATGSTARDLTTEWGTVYLLWFLSPCTRRPVKVNLAILNSQLQCVHQRNRRLIQNFASRMPISRFINGLDPFFVSLNEVQLDEMSEGKGDQSSVFLEVNIEGELL